MGKIENTCRADAVRKPVSNALEKLVKIVHMYQSKTFVNTKKVTKT